MESLLHALGILALFSVCLLALFSLLFGFPGTFVIAGAALIYGWATGFVGVQWSTILWLLILAVIGEGIEFVASSAGAARGTRPSRRVLLAALAGSFIGGFIGMPFFFGIGALLGGLVGAFAGAAAAVVSEGGGVGDSVATGWAAFRGRLVGFVVKAAIAGVMVVLLLAAAV